MMALVTCKNCGRAVNPNKDNTCPQCGWAVADNYNPAGNSPTNEVKLLCKVLKGLAVTGVIAVLIGLVFWMKGNDSPYQESTWYLSAILYGFSDAIFCWTFSVIVECLDEIRNNTKS